MLILAAYGHDKGTALRGRLKGPPCRSLAASFSVTMSSRHDSIFLSSALRNIVPQAWRLGKLGFDLTR